MYILEFFNFKTFCFFLCIAELRQIVNCFLQASCYCHLLIKYFLICEIVQIYAMPCLNLDDHIIYCGTPLMHIQKNLSSMKHFKSPESVHVKLVSLYLGFLNIGKIGHRSEKTVPCWQFILSLKCPLITASHVIHLTIINNLMGDLLK